MYCRNCGNLMDPNAAVCVKCGVKAGVGSNFCPNCGEACDPNASVCVKCGVSFSAVNPNGKSKLVAGLLGIFLGSLGIHRFYLGYTKIAVIQIIVSIVTCGIGGVWGFIEGILILCDKYITTDADGGALKD